MVSAIEKARIQSRKAIESLYDCTCTIRAYEKFKDHVTKETKTGINPIPKYDNQPCRVSKKSMGSNNQTDTINQVAYELKLFISPNIKISQGDEIEVIRYGTNTKYKAGEGFLYPSHQEVILTKVGKA